MKSLTVTEVSFSDLLSQAFSSVHGEILEILKEALSSSLELLRDRVIGSGRYRRGSRYKRWGYSVRKWIQTPVGLLQDVAIPRVRSSQCEIHLFLERFCRRSKEIEEVLLEGYLWGLSSRRLSVLMKRLFKSSLSHSGICRLKDQLRAVVEDYRDRAIRADLSALILDGVYLRYRGGGKGVVLFALGVTRTGEILFLGWLPCDVESGRNWRVFLRSLIDRGLKRPDVVVSDDGGGIMDSLKMIWKDPPSHQLCLWHLSVNLSRHLSDRSYRNIRHFNRDFWEIFSSLGLNEAYNRLKDFTEKWRQKEPDAVFLLMSKRDQIFHFYDYPIQWRHRLRTTNLAEGFFRHLRTFMRRYPGWVDENQISMTIGFYLLGMKAFHANRDKLYNKEMPCSILKLKFNRIY